MFADALYTISTFSPLMPLVLGMFSVGKLDTNSRSILLLLIVATISQLNASYNNNRDERWMMFNIYSILDAFVWSLVFFRNSRSRITKSAILFVFVVQLVLFLTVVAKIGLSTRFLYDFVCMNSLLQVIWVLTFFYERYKISHINAIENEPLFWFCLGLLVYCPTTYFLFVFYDQVRERDGQWIIHSLINTFMYLIFSFGIYVNFKKSIKLTHAGR